MCDRCLTIDYAVADCWRPCYLPSKRAIIPATPRGGFSEDDYDAQFKINRLMAVIRAQRAEIAVLKATQLPTNSHESLEGIDG